MHSARSTQFDAAQLPRRRCPLIAGGACQVLAGRGCPFGAQTCPLLATSSSAPSAASHARE